MYSERKDTLSGHVEFIDAEQKYLYVVWLYLAYQELTVVLVINPVAYNLKFYEYYYTRNNKLYIAKLYKYFIFQHDYSLCTFLN